MWNTFWVLFRHIHIWVLVPGCAGFIAAEGLADSVGVFTDEKN